MSKTTAFSRAAVIIALLALTACSNLDETQQKMLSGGAAGAAIGAVGTVITGGCVACGAAIGGAVGVGAGYVLDKIQNNTKSDSPDTGPAPSHVSSNSGNGYYTSSPPPSNGTGYSNGSSGSGQY